MYVSQCWRICHSRGATEATTRKQIKRPADSRNFPKEIASVCRSRPAYSRFSPIEQTFDSRIPSLRAIPNSTQIRYVSFHIQLIPSLRAIPNSTQIRYVSFHIQFSFHEIRKNQANLSSSSGFSKCRDALVTVTLFFSIWITQWRLHLEHLCNPVTIIFPHISRVPHRGQLETFKSARRTSLIMVPPHIERLNEAKSLLLYRIKSQ